MTGRFGVVVILALMAGGCGKQDDAAAPAAAASPSTGAVASSSTLDEGPRASEAGIDEKQAEEGKRLFQDKGCSACHSFGKRATGPDLAGVTRRRTAKWIENQILHPDKMTKEDPIARKLFAEFALQMPNQGLTEAQARAVVEFFKHQDHEAAETH